MNITYQFAPGDRVSVDVRSGYPAGTHPAIIIKREPYQGRPGYRVQWDYGRPPKQWESAGGWKPETVCTATLRG